MVKPFKRSLIVTFFLSLVLCASLNSIVFGQNAPPQAQGQTVLLSDREYVLSLAVLGFGLLVIICEVFLLRSFKGTADNVLLVIVTTLIVIAGLFIITAGLTTEQVAPAFGLYGAIVGYLLGKDSKVSVQEKENKNDK